MVLQTHVRYLFSSCMWKIVIQDSHSFCYLLDGGVWSYDAIAATLGVPVSKVKSDIHRGRAALKKELTVPHGSR